MFLAFERHVSRFTFRPHKATCTRPPGLQLQCFSVFCCMNRVSEEGGGFQLRFRRIIFTHEEVIFYCSKQ